MSRGQRLDWYAVEDLEDLCDALEPGDLLEFDMGWFCHWAVCVETKECVMMVHRVSATNVVGFLAHQSVSRSGHAKGDIVKQALHQYVSEAKGCVRKVRINNGEDSKWTPRDKCEIVKFAENAVGCKDFGDYNVVENNCEHFANLCRYGEKRSGQVDTVENAFIGVAAGLAIVGVVGGAVALWNHFTGSAEQPKRKQKDHYGWLRE